MVNKLKPEKFQLIKAIALSKTTWLRFVKRDIDGQGRTSFNLLKQLVEVDQDDFIETLETLYLNMQGQFRNMISVAVVEGRPYTVETYRLLWGRMCLIMYFFYHDDPFWRNIGFREMFEKENLKHLRDDLANAMVCVNNYYKRQDKVHAYKTPEQKIAEGAPHPNDFAELINPQEVFSQINRLKEQLTQKEEENQKLLGRIQELEAQLNIVHLSFIETEGKNPDVIKCVYIDIKKATASPAEMAECIHDLQIRGLLKNQERYKKLKNLTKIHKELQETYHFEWTCDALRRALNRKTAKK